MGSNSPPEGPEMGSAGETVKHMEGRGMGSGRKSDGSHRKKIGKRIKKRVKRVTVRSKAIRKKVHDGRVVITTKVHETGEKVRGRTERSPWLARLVALAIGMLDGSVIILFKLGTNYISGKIGEKNFDISCPQHWYYIIANPYILIGTLIAIVSILGMTGAFSHERSHRLFSVIGGTSYITIVLASKVILDEKIIMWVFVGVGIILVSLSISNVYHTLLWFRDKVKYLGSIK